MTILRFITIGKRNTSRQPEDTYSCGWVASKEGSLEKKVNKDPMHSGARLLVMLPAVLINCLAPTSLFAVFTSETMAADAMHIREVVNRVVADNGRDGKPMHLRIGDDRPERDSCHRVPFRGHPISESFLRLLQAAIPGKRCSGWWVNLLP